MKPYAAYSWPFDSEIKTEVEHQLSRLKNLGIDQTKIGFEVEFHLPEAPSNNAISVYTASAIPPNEHWKDMQRTILEALEKDSHGNAELIAQVKEFKPRDVLMYDLLVLDPRTRDILIPLTPAEYYDGPVLEAKIRETDPLTAIKNYEIFMEALFEKSVIYGLNSTIENDVPPGIHLNISFWKNGINISDPSALQQASASGTTDTAKIIEGIARVLHDMRVNFYSKDFANKSGGLATAKMAPTTVGPARSDTLRLKGVDDEARFEVSLTNETSRQHIPLIVSNLLSGAIFALDTENQEYSNDHVLKAKESHRMLCTTKGKASDFMYCQHVLNGSHIDASGKLQPPEDYIAERIKGISAELGFGTPDSKPLSSAAQKSLTQKAVHFFKNIKVTDLGSSYSISCQPTREVTGETIAALESAVNPSTKIDCLRISPGYINDSRLHTESDIIGERISCAMSSEAIKRSISPELWESLYHPEHGALIVSLGTPSATATIAAQKSESTIISASKNPSGQTASRNASWFAWP